jgi:hypothetical protein
MDTRELTHALREATADLTPPPGFAEAVVDGGRRRRTRARIGAAAVVATAAAVAAVVVVGPTQLAAPPAGRSTVAPTPPAEPKVDKRLTMSGGDLLDDDEATGRILDAWNIGIDSKPPHQGLPVGLVDLDLYQDRLGEPHVYWHGTTPAGPAAIVMQNIRVPETDEFPPERRGQVELAIGLVASPDGRAGEPASRVFQPALLGIQSESSAPGGFFLMPDDRTVVAVNPFQADEAGDQAGDQALWVSDAISYGDDGRSHREWTELSSGELVSMVHLPEDTTPLNIRLVVGPANEPPSREGKMGAHLELRITSSYPETAPATPDRGLRWTARMAVGQPRRVDRPEDVFTAALRDSGVLDASSYTNDSPEWTVVAGMADGRTAVLGEKQELDNPAYVYAVLLDHQGAVQRVERVGVARREVALPVVYRLPDEQFVVAAHGRQLSWRGSSTEAWSASVTDAALVPAESTQVRVGTEVVELPR